MLRRRGRSLLPIVWIVLGIIVAATHGHFAALSTPSAIGSAILAVILWPLIPLNVHIAI